MGMQGQQECSEEHTCIIMHACEIRDTLEVQSFWIWIMHVACEELLHVLENSGIFSVLLGIYFYFISI